MTQPPNNVLCSGILVADIFIPTIDQIPTPGTLTATNDFLIEIGGCAANVAVSLTKLGVKSSVFGRVGDDLFGHFIQDKLDSYGIGTEGVSATSEFGTSKTVILTVKGDDRRYIHTFGANAALRVKNIDREQVAAAKILYMGGYLILPAMDAKELANLFQFAQENQTQTVLDVVVPTGSKHRVESLERILAHTDVFVPNTEEACILTGESDSHKQAEQFLNAGCGAVVITKGERGTLYKDSTHTIELPPFQIDYVDGSGAGDAFTAGFITGMLENWDVEKRVRFASAVGASACTKMGCTTGVFSRDEALTFIEKG